MARIRRWVFWDNNRMDFLFGCYVYFPQDVKRVRLILLKLKIPFLYNNKYSHYLCFQLTKIQFNQLIMLRVDSHGPHGVPLQIAIQWSPGREK